jgi:phospholipid transport system substrate-binding protein
VKTFTYTKNSLKPIKQLSLVSVFVMLSFAGTSFASVSAEETQQQSAVQVTLADRVKIAQDDPYAMVEQAASKTFDRIKAEQTHIKQDPETLRTIMEEELMPYIDYKFSSFKVLGKYARQVEKKELLEFVSVFREYLITTYAVAMGYYDEQEVEFDPVRDYGDRTDVTVRAVIKDDTRPDIKVAFKVRKDPRSGDWQAYDMIAEGISLLSSKQTEFESILRKEGIVRVIELMRESIRQPIVLNDVDESKDNTANEKI